MLLVVLSKFFFFLHLLMCYELCKGLLFFIFRIVGITAILLFMCIRQRGVEIFLIIILLSSYSDALIHCAHCILHSSKEALKQQDSVSF